LHCPYIYADRGSLVVLSTGTGTCEKVLVIIIIIIITGNDIYRAQTSPRSKCAKSAVAQ